MSMFPDCRVDDFYNEDFLNRKDREFILGFDWAVEQVQNLIENNLDVYEQELTETCDEVEDDEVYASRRDLYDIVEENKELLSTIIGHWIESERNMLITSMIDNMDEAEYSRLRAKALEENKDKEYFDSRHYACTGEKVFHENGE